MRYFTRVQGIDQVVKGKSNRRFPGPIVLQTLPSITEIVDRTARLNREMKSGSCEPKRIAAAHPETNILPQHLALLSSKASKSAFSEREYEEQKCLQSPLTEEQKELLPQLVLASPKILRDVLSLDLKEVLLVALPSIEAKLVVSAAMTLIDLRNSLPTREEVVDRLFIAKSDTEGCYGDEAHELAVCLAQAQFVPNERRAVEFSKRLLYEQITTEICALDPVQSNDEDRIRLFLQRDAVKRIGAESFCSLADIDEHELEWLWDRRIPLGTISVLEGDPGVGKSFLTIDLAARVSRGDAMPDDPIRTSNTPGAVLICSAEDDISSVIKKRLRLANANQNNVYCLGTVEDSEGRRPLRFPEDLPLVALRAIQIKAKLIIIDPFSAFLTQKVDSHKDADVRRVLFAIADVASLTKAAVVIVRHLTKNSSEKNPKYRGGGSIAIIGASRSGLLVAEDPNHRATKVLACIKCNLTDKPPSLAYRIEPIPEEKSARVVWIGESRLQAEDLLQCTNSRGRKPVERLRATQFLRETLSTGSQEASQIKEEADKRGICERTLKRAKEEIAKSFRKNNAWHWKLQKNTTE